MNWFTTQALSLALPLITGGLAFLGVQWAKKGSDAFDNAPAFVKQAAAIVLSFILASASPLVADLLPHACIISGDASTCLHAIAQPDAFKVIIAWLVSHVIHAGVSKDANAASTK